MRARPRSKLLTRPRAGPSERRSCGRRGPGELAAALGVTPAAMVALCDRLESKGYLERVPDAADRRITWFQLTGPAAELAAGRGTAQPARPGRHGPGMLADR